MGNRRGGRENCDPGFLAVLLEAPRKGDQPRYFLITDGFARISSDRQADSSWERRKQPTCSYASHFLSETEINKILADSFESVKIGIAKNQALFEIENCKNQCL